MGKSGIMGFAVVGLLVLATIWLYNRFAGEGKTVGTLGVKT
jgi:hypothetical protein